MYRLRPELEVHRLSREGKLEELRRRNPERKPDVDGLLGAIKGGQNLVIQYWMHECATVPSSIDLADVLKDKTVAELASNVALKFILGPEDRPIPDRTYVRISMPPGKVHRERLFRLCQCLVGTHEVVTRVQTVLIRQLPYQRAESSDLRLYFVATTNKAIANDEKSSSVLASSSDKQPRMVTVDLEGVGDVVAEFDPLEAKITRIVDAKTNKVVVMPSVNYATIGVLRFINGQGFSIRSNLNAKDVAWDWSKYDDTA